MRELLITIVRDSYDATAYLPVSLLAGFLALPAWFYYRGRKRGKTEWAALSLLFVSVAFVLQMTVFSREPSPWGGIELIPFGTWGLGVEAKACVFENILLFVPVGFFLACALPLFRKFGWNFFACLFFSYGIEFTQMVTGRGYCQTEDVLTNVLGGTAGFFLFCITAKI